MGSSVVIWALIIVGPIVVGVLLALRLDKKPALILSGLIPWVLCLAFNLHSEFFPTGEKEPLIGFWPVFQLVVGSTAAIIGAAACWLAQMVRKE